MDDATALRDYGSLTRKIAWKHALRLPANIEFDDLVQAGFIGLIAAARRFDDSLGATFKTYAGLRINGAIIDQLRSDSFLSRGGQAAGWDVQVATDEVDEAIDTKMAGPEYDPVERCAEREHMQALCAVIPRLLPREVMILEAMLVEGISGRELALRMGVTAGRITQMVAALTVKLRRLVASPDRSMAQLAA